MDVRVNDLLLIYHGQIPLIYARVEDISADVKPGWWQLSLLLLKLPLQHVTWILREEYIDGADFSMGGQAMRLERLPSPGVCLMAEEPPSRPVAPGENKPAFREERGKVITLRPRAETKPSDPDIA